MYLSAYSNLYLVVATRDGAHVASRICDNLGDLRLAIGEFMTTYPDCAIEAGAGVLAPPRRRDAAATRAAILEAAKVASKRYYDSEPAGELSMDVLEVL